MPRVKPMYKAICHPFTYFSPFQKLGSDLIFLKVLMLSFG